MDVPTVFRPYAEALPAYADRHPEVAGVTADLTVSCEVDTFRDRFPERFLNLGMAEQNLMGVVGGLARSGVLPVVHSFGVFLTRRPFDQLSMAVALPRRRVRLMGFLPGLSTPGGPTHQAIDDMALTRALPGFTVLDLGDATEIMSVLEAAHDVDGPVYARLVRGHVPVVFETPMVVGSNRHLAKGHDLTIISSGIATAEAISASATLAFNGIGVDHFHVSTIKPLHDADLLESIARSGKVISVENHLVTGGLGSAVAERMAEAGLPARLRRVGLRDTYATGGSQAYLFERFGLSAAAIVSVAEELVGQRLSRGVPTADSMLPDAGDVSRQEAL
jgi:transketolase